MIKRVSKLLAVIYIVFAFVSKELNPLDWHVAGRVAFVCLLFFVWGFWEDSIRNEA